MGALAGMAPSRDDIARVHFYRQALADLGRAVASGAWLLAQLLQLALNAADAIGRALYRLFVSRRRLLEWTTAAAAQAAATTSLRRAVRQHWRTPVAAVVLWIALLASGTAWPASASLLCLVWALAPVWTWWVSRPRPRQHGDALSSADRFYLHDIARDTWRLFERCVGPDDRNLPPDNLQTTPSEMVAHRTSPTNIGLYLLSCACAHRFGWIGAIEMIERIEATLATLAAMERHRGHFLNWYDTRNAEPLTPLYVSTVDSGNLCTHLMALAQACLAACQAPLGNDVAAARAGALAGADRGAARRRRADARRAGAGGGARPARAAGAASRATRLRSRPGSTPPTAELAGADTVARRRRAGADTGAAARLGARGPPGDAALGLAQRRERRDRRERDGASDRHRHDLPADRRRARLRLSLPPQAAPVPHRLSRHRAPARQRLLRPARLGSARHRACGRSPRATSPPAHWAALGRPFYAVGALAGLRSWSGSMFEYLMPTLILDEPYGSVLHSAALAAVQEHIAFAREHHVPWGISECAYAASDHTLAYQYAPQGVPRLALRRTPSDELVIAPYATALAAQVAPHRADDQPAPARAGARARPLRLHRGARLLARAPAGRRGRRARVHLHGAPPGDEHRRARQRPARRRGAPLGHGRCAGRGGGLAAARARAARGAAAARAAGEPDDEPAEATARHVPRNHARHDGDRADPSALERSLRGRAARQRRRRQPLGQRHSLARARRRAARRLRLVLPPALGSPAAAGVADPASGARLGRALPLQLPRRPRRCSTPPGPRSRRRRRSGSARKTTSSSAASSCTTTATARSTSS